MAYSVEPLLEEPQEIILEMHPEIGAEYNYKQIVITCDQQGNCIKSKDAIVVLGTALSLSSLMAIFAHV